MNGMIIAMVVVAVLAVAVIAALLVVSKRQKMESERRLSDAKEQMEQRAKMYEEQLAETKAQVSALTSQKDELSAKVNTLTAENASKASALAERDKLEKERKGDADRMKDAFKALSAENSEAFEKRSEKTIADMLKPVQEKFAEFSKAVKEGQDKALERHTQLQQKITDLEGQSKSIGEEARNLADALTGYSKVQGDFGEMLLTDVLRSAGMVDGVHFVAQGVITDSEGREIKSEGGRTMIPDVMVNYPDGTVVIIDSKVSLTAYSKYMSANTVEERRHYAKEHVKSVQSHVDELKKKDYASYIPSGKSKVPYNIMFLPMEGAFRLMLDESPMLWQTAKDNNVLIVSQMTLIIVLNMIMMSWRQHDQEKNIEDVYKTASELMGQLRGWLESYVKVGSSLDAVRKNYDDSIRRLDGSNQSALKKGDTMLGKIRKLENLGLAPKASKAKIRPDARLSSPGTIIPAELDCGLPSDSDSLPEKSNTPEVKEVD